ncbi:CrcB family protein [Nocardia sp. NBC_00565]|uniref:fluoride efflux transporter FluC n=1 Tax=Nocardia sp. NBC_00565 TaxID=2975993 RepID=UPI002E80FA95|nr:CrcB family protein [Nocardia sp. NBC_00565]WUC03457.1 CrcB family protein [Nocardia sp. NBC_00565]
MTSHDSTDPVPPATGPELEPIDPDTAVDSWAPPQPRRQQVWIVVAIAVGGVIGACARYGTTLAWPTASTAFPWITWWINITGCAAMGVLMVTITERFTVHPLIRPLLGTGVLGGYTTFSTATIDAQRLLDHDRAMTALLYLLTTPLTALAAMRVTTTLTHAVLGPRPQGRSRP